MKLTSAGTATVVTLVDPAYGDYQPAPAESVGLTLVKYQIEAGYEYSYAVAGAEVEQQVDARIIAANDIAARAVWITLKNLIKNPAEQPFGVVFNDGLASTAFDDLWYITRAVPDFRSGFRGHIPLALTMLRKQT